MDLDGKKVLIVRLSALGDVIRTLPAVLGLMERFPRTEWCWLVENSSAGLLRALPQIRLLELDRAALKAKRWSTRRRTVKDMIDRIKDEQFDASLDFHGVLKSGMFAWRARIPRRIGFEKGGSKEGHRFLINDRFVLPSPHISRYERNLSLARYLDPDVRPVRPHFQLSDEALAVTASVTAERPLVLFPGTSEHGRNKRWPAEHWAELYRRLAADFPVTFSFGPADGVYQKGIAEQLGFQPPALPGMKLDALAMTLQACRGLVSCDTGPMHLAAVMGTPITVLMGPSDPVLNQPLTGPHRLVLPEVPCAPCRNRSCPVLICQDNTTVNRVERAVREMLSALPV